MNEKLRDALALEILREFNEIGPRNYVTITMCQQVATRLLESVPREVELAHEIGQIIGEVIASPTTPSQAIAGNAGFHVARFIRSRCWGWNGE